MIVGRYLFLVMLKNNRNALFKMYTGVDVVIGLMKTI